ncbi:suppressor of clathrin deficiency [Tyrophagus putrescentiae]|nr:suppressor of clathrin deficiency [Tyrophagus putrescentiae]
MAASVMTAHSAVQAFTVVEGDDGPLRKKDDGPLCERKLPNLNAFTRPPPPYQPKIVWPNVVLMGALHCSALYSCSLLAAITTGTYLYLMLLIILSLIGIQAGAHRLWSHRSYQAAAGLRLFLALCHVLAGQNDIFEWCRDHRAHHKWPETDADPHNAKRGFFFSHVGWLLVRKHPEVIRRGRTLDLGDLKADPVVTFQRTHFRELVLLFWAVLPTTIPVVAFGERPLYAFLVCVVLRYAYTLNMTWMTNSWAHMYGWRPYDSSQSAVESTTRHIQCGEGKQTCDDAFTTFTTAFPSDYSASELGPADVFNPMTAIINLFAFMGWAWDLKKTSPSLVESRAANCGFGESFYKLRKRKKYLQWSEVAIEWAGGLATLFVPLAALRYLLLPAIQQVVDGWK